MTLREQIAREIDPHAFVSDGPIFRNRDRLALKRASRILQFIRAHDRKMIEAQDAVIEAARDLVLLWQVQKISGATRTQRNAAIEGLRQQLIEVIAALDAVLKGMEEK